MDLLAPCRSCLQCLPFFHVSPPSSPRPAPTAPSSSPYSQEASKATSTDPSQSAENLPCPNVATAAQEQDLPLPSKEEEPQDTKCDKDETVEKFKDELSTVTESEEAHISGIVIAPPVSASGGAAFAEDVEDTKTTTFSELPLQVPFINDISFSASGLMPLPSPITPAPFGAGYHAGQYPPYGQIYQGQHHGHTHLHHEHENSHHDHEHSLHGHESSHVEDANSHHGRDHSHHGHDHSHDGHGPQHSHEHVAPDYELPLPKPPLDDSQVIPEPHNDASFHHPHHHNHDSLIVDDADNSVTGHVSLDEDHPHHDQDDISLIPPLETTQSTPNLDLEGTVSGENSAVSHTNGASALLETYHSEPVVVFGDPHDDDSEVQDEVLGHSGSHLPRPRRRRDHFKDQLKGVKQQIKQGGHHVKEEGSKHMQTIIDNMNRQAQQIEQSGSFFMVPRN